MILATFPSFPIQGWSASGDTYYIWMQMTLNQRKTQGKSSKYGCNSKFKNKDLFIHSAAFWRIKWDGLLVFVKHLAQSLAQTRLSINASAFLPLFPLLNSLLNLLLIKILCFPQRLVTLNILLCYWFGMLGMQKIKCRGSRQIESKLITEKSLWVCCCCCSLLIMCNYRNLQRSF